MTHKQDKSRSKIVVGGVPEHFNLPWHLAIEQNAFDPLGVDLEFIEFRGGTGAMSRALRDGEIDIALLLTEGCVAELLKGNQSKIVKVYVASPLIWGIHVAADSEIKTIDQMRGRRYAISRFGSGSHLMAIVDAAERGWPIDELQFVSIRNLKGARETLAAHEADVFFWEKYTTSPIVCSGEFRRIGVRQTLWPAFVVCVREVCLDNQARLIRRILSIVDSFCAELMVHDNAIELISDRYGLRQELVEEWFALTKWEIGFSKPIEALETARDYLEKLDLVPKSEILTKDLWFDL